MQQVNQIIAGRQLYLRRNPNAQRSTIEKNKGTRREQQETKGSNKFIIKITAVNQE